MNLDETRTQGQKESKSCHEGNSTDYKQEQDTREEKYPLISAESRTRWKNKAKTIGFPERALST